MRLALALRLLVGSAAAQVTSSGNMGCAITAAGYTECIGIEVPETKQTKSLPKLFVTDFTIEAGAALATPGPYSFATSKRQIMRLHCGNHIT